VHKFGDSMILIINLPVINRHWKNYNDSIFIIKTIGLSSKFKVLIKCKLQMFKIRKSSNSVTIFLLFFFTNDGNK